MYRLFLAVFLLVPVVATNNKANVVSRVVDGDTVVMENGTHIRFIGINTPEKNVCYGPEATEFTKSLLPVGTVVKVSRPSKARDKYGRTLAVLTRKSDGLNVSVAILKAGMAKTFLINNAGRFQKQFLAAEQKAKSNASGLWSNCP